MRMYRTKQCHVQPQMKIMRCVSKAGHQCKPTPFCFVLPLSIPASCELPSTVRFQLRSTLRSPVPRFSLMMNTKPTHTSSLGTKVLPLLQPALETYPTHVLPPFAPIFDAISCVYASPCHAALTHQFLTSPLSAHMHHLP